jgi:RNA-binding protein PNO1
MCVCV